MAIWRADVEGKAFETIRAALLERPVLYKPDYKAQFFLQTDASDDGKGAVLWQKGKDGARRIIAWYSKAWNASQRARPVFYREAEALFWGIEKAKYYSESSAEPLFCETDQQPLQWVRHSEKGAVCNWRAEKAAGVDYIVKYVPGKDNMADAPSRYPMLGPKTLTRVGLQHSLEQLLDFLPSTARDAPKAWVYAGRDTDALSRVVQRWRKPSNAILRRAYRADAKYTADLHVFAPTPVNAPGLVRDLLKQDVPFAVLIPSDLVQCVSEVSVARSTRRSSAASPSVRSSPSSPAASRGSWAGSVPRRT